MRNAFIVSYDITEPKRWRKVFKTMHGFGSRIQYSVFRCELSPADKVRMMAKLEPLINHQEDQILIIDIGPAPGRGDNCTDHLGRAPLSVQRRPIVV